MGYADVCVEAPLAFDYAELDTETRIVVQQRTSEIRTLMKRTAQDIIDIGQKLIEVKERLPHGEFGPWLQHEFEWSDFTARQFMNVAKAFKTENFSDFQISASALYLLAAPSTPEPARIEAIALAEQGQTVTHKAAKAIVSNYKPPKPSAQPLPKVAEFDELTEAEADELQVFKPDSSPEAIRECIEAGYIQPTAAAPLSAEGKPILIDDCIAYAASPTELIGRVTAYAPGGRIEYTRFKQTLYADAAVVVHQQSVASPHAAPHPAPLPTADAQTTAEPPTSVTGDSEGRSRMAIHYSSETPEHYTPCEVIDAVVDCLGAIDLDPCSNSHHTPNVSATNHYTRDDDGLTQPWQGRVYMNPPYGREIGAWVEKLCSEHEAGNVSAAIALVPARTDTQWFKRLQDYVWCGVEGRLKFVGNEDAAPFPSAIFYLGPDIGAFYRCFAELGNIWQRINPDMLGE